MYHHTYDNSIAATHCAERVTQLIYELLDAHDDTARLVEGGAARDSEWAAHLCYLRDLQRLGREELARLT